MNFIINLFLALAFALPVTFVLHPLFKKRFQNFKHSFLACLLISYFLCGIAVAFFIFASHFDYIPAENKKFSIEKWSVDKKERYKMVQNLIEDSILINKNRSKLIEMLGKPNEEDKTSIKYLTGIKGSLYPEFYFLKIDFKEDTSVKAESYIVHDN